MASSSPPLPPSVLPLFPLTGTLLLPGNWLPLNIFEPRYRHMIEDVMAGERYIGLIQPFLPQLDNSPPSGWEPDDPELYRVGCAGLIDRCEPQSDGRFLIRLLGVSRFALREELPLHRGYRRAAVDYDEFVADLAEPQKELDPGRLLHALRHFSGGRGLEFDWDLLAALPGVALLNGLAVALPFQPAEKQALLEAANPELREEMLLALLGMGLDSITGDAFAPPVVN